MRVLDEYAPVQSRGSDRRDSIQYGRVLIYQRSKCQHVVYTEGRVVGEAPHVPALRVENIHPRYSGFIIEFKYVTSSDISKFHR